MTTNKREYYIDNLRWMILLILIPYHAAQAWNTWGEANYIFFEGNKLISSIIVFFSPYFMPLLFVIAGISTRYALRKRTTREYLIDRAKRLVIPLLFGTIVLMPVMTYLADKYNYSYSGGFVEHYGIFFTKFTDLIGADGGFSFGQFWFLLYLMIISIVGVGAIKLLKKYNLEDKKDISFWIVLILGAPLPLLSELLSIGGKSFVEFTYLFLIGYYVFFNETIINKLQKNCILLFGIGLISSVMNVYLFIWLEDFALLNTIMKYVAKWFMILALFGLGKRYLNFNGKISNYMNKMSFLFYVYHFIWVVVFQYVLYETIGKNTLVLFMSTVVLSYIVTFICCEISIRIPVLRFLTGVGNKGK